MEKPISTDTHATSLAATLVASDNRAYFHALDCVALPVFLLEPDCKIFEQNHAATELLRASVLFRKTKGMLTLSRKDNNSTFADGVLKVHQQAKAQLVRLLRRTGDPGCVVNLVPVLGTNLVVTCVADLRAPLTHSTGWSREVFGFNATTASLAEGLADGLSLAEFAALHELPIGTVRTRLKKLLAQTGTSSQSGLVRLLLRAATLSLASDGI